MDPSKLARLMDPASIAVVGASENLAMSNNAVLPMLEAGRDVFLINPNRDSVYGRPTAPTLGHLGRPVDAVLSLVSADRSIGVVEEARELGCGGVAVAAGGFAELGAKGVALQDRLVDAAGPSLAVVGPNCSGFMNVRSGANLFTGGRISLTPGPVAVVSQSGFLLRSCLAAGQQRQLGFGVVVSSGNEAVCGLPDYLDLFADDPATTVVCLVIEKVRDARSFLGAVSRARAAGKAIVALKLGRTDRSRDIMRSHTGAIADESWVYDLVLGQAGVVTAGDVDELLDKAQLLAQLPPQRWRPTRGAAVMASSGGVAGVAADLSVEEDVALADLSALESWVRERIPAEGASLNPLDLTGFVMRDQELLKEIFSKYAHADGVDALVLCWWAGEDDEGWAKTLLNPFAEAAAAASVPLIVSPVEATAIGSWTSTYKQEGLAFCRGLRSTFRALRALDTASSAALDLGAPAPPAAAPPPRLVQSALGPMVTFADAMALVDAAGIAVAPFVVLGEGMEDDTAIDGLGDRLVVKLADVPHRTELGAVRVGVAPTDVATVVRDLRALAASHGVPGTIAVQAMIGGLGEAFIGLQGSTDLGPVLLFGRGGILVESGRRVGGRLLPVSADAAGTLVAEVAGDIAAVRGQERWPLDPLIASVRAADRLWSATGSWLASADLNPLIVTAEGAVAVDVLLVAAAGLSPDAAEPG